MNAKIVMNIGICGYTIITNNIVVLLKLLNIGMLVTTEISNPLQCH